MQDVYLKFFEGVKDELKQVEAENELFDIIFHGSAENFDPYQELDFTLITSKPLVDEGHFYTQVRRRFSDMKIFFDISNMTKEELMSTEDDDSVRMMKLKLVDTGRPLFLKLPAADQFSISKRHEMMKRLFDDLYKHFGTLRPKDILLLGVYASYFIENANLPQKLGKKILFQEFLKLKSKAPVWKKTYDLMSFLKSRKAKFFTYLSPTSRNHYVLSLREELDQLKDRLWPQSSLDRDLT